jgi:hypothetical protein
MLLAVSLAWAGGEKAKMDPAAKAAKLQAKLDLTDTQTEQVRALIEDVHSRWAEAKAGGQSEAAKAEAKKELKAEFYSRLKSILTEEQVARYDKMEAEYGHQKHK